MFHPGILRSLMAGSIESFDFSVNIWLQILEKTLDIRALFYHRGSAVKLCLRSMAVLSNALLSGEAAKARAQYYEEHSKWPDSFSSLPIHRESATGIVCITDYTLKFVHFVCFLCTSRFPLFKSFFFPIRVYLSRANFYQV